MSINLENVTIKELSSKAEIINIFNCLSGEISIFNGPSSAISSLQRLLTGTYEKNNLKISINNSIKFNPLEHVLVGYNNIIKDSTASIEDLFLSYNIPMEDIDTILNTYGLHNIRQLKIYELDGDKKKRLEFAIAFQSSNKALIIRDPFEDISPQWKEPYAKFIYTYATKKNLPVIISELDYNPATWNNLPSIKKMQLGISTNKTIGFGSDNGQLKEFLSQIRTELDNEQTQNGLTTINNDVKEPINNTSHDKIKLAQSPKISGTKVKEIESGKPQVLVNNVTIQNLSNENKKLTKKELQRIHQKLFLVCFILVALTSTLSLLLINMQAKKNIDKINSQKEKLDKIIPLQLNTDLLEKSYILNSYPSKIKNLIEIQLTRKQILDTKEVLPLVKNNIAEQPKKGNQNLFALLESISGTGKDLPDQIRKTDAPTSNFNTNTHYNNINQMNQGNQFQQNQPAQQQISNAEAKRQLIYQRFQEAMKRKKN